MVGRLYFQSASVRSRANASKAVVSASPLEVLSRMLLDTIHAQSIRADVNKSSCSSTTTSWASGSELTLEFA